MSLAANFLGGAAGRLLPASIPFRFFATAAALHVLMWLALLLSAGEAVGFRGGLGPALATVHVLTLGVLTMTAIGASAQLLPVATRRALAAVWPIKVVYWLGLAGLIALIAGMSTAQPGVLIPAAVATTAALLLYGGILADNLRRSGSLPVIAAYGWAALVSLVLLVTLGVTLSFNYELGFLPNHGSVALAHLILGGCGFMGLLAIGFSHILVPMFTLASAPARRPSLFGLVLACSAVALGALGAIIDRPGLLAAAALTGLAAAGLHIWLMLTALKTGMRKRLGLSFTLIRASWAMLLLSIAVGLAAVYGGAGANGATLFGLLLLGGWLLTFLFGVLQRILPFLASMHTSQSANSAPLPVSELAESVWLKLHAACHGIALTLLAVAIIGDIGWVMRLGAAVGLVGALAFAWFTGDIVRRIAAMWR